MSRPSDVCRGLLAALDVSEGRRKRRARDTAADAIGLGIKRTLLDAAVHDSTPARHRTTALAPRPHRDPTVA